MENDKKKTKAKEVKEEVVVVEEEELTEEELDKASGGSDASYLPHIQPDGKYFPPAPTW